ncbi:hypothetical protein PIB30_079921 [Stylosanthes scabra]|uniref:Uncharacterized protein n=1 Tax=Stylosanthes scabra TaxID=79078 RepID=A0ABU6RR40_9FABA|nr:hypothetical protein [Stylosanthes scabra]
MSLRRRHHLQGSSSFTDVLFRSSLFPSSSTPSSIRPLQSSRIVAASCSPRPVIFVGGFPSMSLFKARVSARRSLTALQFGAMMENARAQESEFE